MISEKRQAEGRRGGFVKFLILPMEKNCESSCPRLGMYSTVPYSQSASRCVCVQWSEAIDFKVCLAVAYTDATPFPHSRLATFPDRQPTNQSYGIINLSPERETSPSACMCLLFYYRPSPPNWLGEPPSMQYNVLYEAPAVQVATRGSVTR